MGMYRQSHQITLDFSQINRPTHQRQMVTDPGKAKSREVVTVHGVEPEAFRGPRRPTQSEPAGMNESIVDPGHLRDEKGEWRPQGAIVSATTDLEPQT